jgi:hypothetical protein
MLKNGTVEEYSSEFQPISQGRLKPNSKSEQWKLPSKRDRKKFHAELERINNMLAEFSDRPRENNHQNLDTININVDTRSKTTDSTSLRGSSAAGDFYPRESLSLTDADCSKDKDFFIKLDTNTFVSGDNATHDSPNSFHSQPQPACDCSLGISESTAEFTHEDQQGSSELNLYDAVLIQTSELGLATTEVDISRIGRSRQRLRSTSGSPLKSSFKIKAGGSAQAGKEADRRVRFDAGEKVSKAHGSVSSFMGKMIKSMAKSLLGKMSRITNLSKMMSSNKIRINGEV